MKEIKKNLYLLYAYSCLVQMLFFGAVSVPFFLHRAGMNYTQMFILEAIFALSLLLLEIPTGIVADRYGRKTSLFCGSILSAISFFIFGMFTGFPLYVVAEIVCGLGLSLISGADRALLYDLLVKHNSADQATSVFSRFDGWATAGRLVAFPLGSLLVSSGLLPYKTALGAVFVLSGIAVLLGSMIVLWVTEPTSGPYEKKQFLRAGVDGLKFIFTQKRLRRFALNFASISSLTFFMFWFYQSLLLQNGFSVSINGFVAAGFNLLAMILLFWGQRINQKVGLKNALFLSSLIPGLLFLAIFFIDGAVIAFVAIFGVTVLKLYRKPILSALMNVEIEGHNRATVLSGVSMLERLGTMILYPVAGILADISLKWAFLIIGVAVVILSFALKVRDEL